VAALISTLTLFENELQRYLLVNGKELKDIDISGGIATHPFNSPFCNSTTCNMNRSNEGSTIIDQLPLNYRDMQATYWYPTDAAPTRVVLSLLGKIPGVGTDKADLILKIYGLRFDMCQEINRQFDVNRVSGTAISDASGARFTASDIDDSYSYESGKPENYGARIWCDENNQGIYRNYLYFVLYPR
jgi:hypothetical protein